MSGQETGRASTFRCLMDISRRRCQINALAPAPDMRRHENRSPAARGVFRTAARSNPAAPVARPRPRVQRRLRLAQGGELEGGAEGSGCPAGRRSATHLEAENAYTAAVLAGTEALRADASSPRCAGASRRTMPPCRSRTARSPISPAIARAASTRSICREPRGGGAEAILLDGDAEGAGPPFFDLGDAEHSPDHRAPGLERRPKGSEVLHHPRPRPRRPGATCRTRCPDRRASVVWAGDSAALLLRRARREPPPGPGAGATASAPGGGRRDRLRGGRPGLLRRPRRDPVGRLRR